MRLTTITPLYLLTASVAAVWAAPTRAEPGKVVVLDDNGDPITDGVKDTNYRIGNRILTIITRTEDTGIKLPANEPTVDVLMIPKEVTTGDSKDQKIYFRYTGGSDCPPAWPCFGWSALISRSTSERVPAGALLKREQSGDYSVIREKLVIHGTHATVKKVREETEKLKPLAKEWEHAEHLYIDYSQAQP